MLEYKISHFYKRVYDEGTIIMFRIISIDVTSLVVQILYHTEYPNIDFTEILAKML